MAHNISDVMADKYSTWNGPEYSFYTDYGQYSDNSLNIIVGWKGNLYEYGKNFGEMRSIDLASNELTGNIPEEISCLIELKSLNLSGNMLTGKIPQNIGTQLQSFDPSKFMGNAGLCGPPLVEKCPEDVTSNAGGSKKHQEDRDGGSENSQGDRDEFWKCLYVGTGAITTSLKEISGL
ncbi:hypothetical protein CMV_003854 [Castanea mollissima]|uniref:Uncharacterized protein n=1 Tax=Castanea mollissima TaxID=60419 RepID=A0A8J4RV26_9ROSI|nr:hypothetical protein CMV_003854 [Castanea mollissima]